MNSCKTRILFIAFLAIGLVSCNLGIDSLISGTARDAPSEIIGEWRSVDTGDGLDVEAVSGRTDRLLISDNDFENVPIRFSVIAGRDFSVISSSDMSVPDGGRQFFIYIHYVLDDGHLRLFIPNYDLLSRDGIASFSMFACVLNTEHDVHPAESVANACSVYRINDAEKLRVILSSPTYLEYFVPIDEFTREVAR